MAIKKNLSLVDRVVGWGINRWAYAVKSYKAHQLDAEDRELVSMFMSASSASDPFTQMADDQKRRLAMTVSWIYSDIRLFASAFTSAKLETKRINGEELESVKNHPSEALLRKPNDKMSLEFLWQYTIKWMCLRGNGYWFLAPAAGDANRIVEVWPIPADRVKPIPDKEKMVRGYQYTTLSGQPKIIDPKYIVHFQFPNPFSLLDGEVPLNAALLSMETEIGTSKSQRDFYVAGRGMPRSIISLPEDTGERDFEAISAQIRNDFEAEQKVIITRAGDLKATMLGINQKEMELIGQRGFTRDEIDVVFLGFELHGRASESELKTKYRMFKDEVIYPTHKLVAGQITVQLLDRFYEKNLYSEFEDVRAQDRALNVQERNVYWRAKVLDEARADINLPPYHDQEIGQLLVPLATDPAYVAMLKGISRTGVLPDTGEPQSDRRRPTATAAMSEADAPVNVLSDTAEGKSALLLPSPAETEGVKVELERWEKVAIKEAKSGRNPGLYAFKSEIIPRPLYFLVRGELMGAERTKEAVAAVFDALKATRGGNRGRPSKEIQSVNEYQKELEEEYSDWADGFAMDIAKASNEENKKDVIDTALAALLLALIALGRKSIPGALVLALGDMPPTPDLVLKLSEFMSENELYLRDSLIPDIRAKVEKALADPDIILAFQMGLGEEAVRAILGTFQARVESYSGEFWKMLMWGRGSLADLLNKKVYWALDHTIPHENHCATCLQWGDHLYDSFSAMLLETGGIYPTNTLCQSRDRCALNVS